MLIRLQVIALPTPLNEIRLRASAMLDFMGGAFAGPGLMQSIAIGLDRGRAAGLPRSRLLPGFRARRSRGCVVARIQHCYYIIHS